MPKVIRERVTPYLPGSKSLDRSSIANWLWEAACKIRGPVDAPKYKDYILPLIFLKRISDVFEDEISRLANELDQPADVAAQIADSDHSLVKFYLPRASRWGELMKSRIGLGENLTDAMRSVARANPSLAGVLDTMDFNATTQGDRIVSDDHLAEVMQVLQKHRLGLHDVQPDLIGDAYEYLLRKFAEGSGQSAGEFYTPAEVARLLATILDPEPGMEIYDPCCGSAGLLIKCHLRLLEKYGTTGNGHRHLDASTAPVHLYGQEDLATTFAMAKMNTFIHQMEADIRKGDTMTRPKLITEDGRLRKFDRVTANPMWNQDTFQQSTFENDPYGRFTLGIPPTASADWAWVQHMITSLNDTGRMAVILDTGAMFRGSRGTSGRAERMIRQRLIKADLVEAVVLLPPNLFYNTDSPGVILVLNKAKEAHKVGRILLVNASKMFIRKKPKNILTQEGFDKVIRVFQHFEDLPEISRVISNEEALSQNGILLPSWYIRQFLGPGVRSEPLSATRLESEATVKRLREYLEATVEGSQLLLRDWEWTMLGSHVKEVDRKAGCQELPVFSCSKIYGIVIQSDRFDHRQSSEETERYKIVEPGDFVFDPMLLWDGSIGRNHYDYPGLVSPVYTVFRPVDGDLPPDVLELILRSPAMKATFVAISLGTNVRRRKVEFQDFASIKVPVPSASLRPALSAMLSRQRELQSLLSDISMRISGDLAFKLNELLRESDSHLYNVDPRCAKTCA